MRSILGRIALVLALLSLPLTHLVLTPASVSGDCGMQAPSQAIEDYRGQAFIGRVRSVEPQPDRGSRWIITFDIDETLAGAATDTLVVQDGGGDCGTLDPMRLSAGTRVLLSTGVARSDDDPPQLFDTLLWRRVGGGWRFASDALRAGRIAYAYPPRARAATTRGSIVAMVAGGSVPFPAVTCVPGPDAPPGPDEEPGPTGQPSPTPSPSIAPIATSRPAQERTSLGGRWRPMARSPFASWSGTGAWTGDRVVIVGLQQRRAISYDPRRDRWSELPRPPVRFGYRARAFWTGREVVVIGPSRNGRAVIGAAFDPLRSRWRRLPDAPLQRDYVSAVAVDDAIVVTTTDGQRVLGGIAAYRVDADCWETLDLPPIDDLEWSLIGAGRWLVAVAIPWRTTTIAADSAAPVMSVMEMGEARWDPALMTPLGSGTNGPLVAGDQLLFLGEGRNDPDEAPVDAVYDLVERTWRAIDTDCPGMASWSVWTGRVALGAAFALDPGSGACYRIPPSHDRNRRDPVVVWTGRELVRWSGGGGEEIPPSPDGIVFRPPRWATH